MTPSQQADVMAFLAQRMSIKAVADQVGVSQWAVVALIGPPKPEPAE